MYNENCVVPGSPDWTSTYATSSQTQLQLKEDAPPIVKKKGTTLSAQAEISIIELQDLADEIGKLMEAVVGYDLSLELTVTLSGEERPTDEVVEKVNEILTEISTDLVLK